MTVPDGMPEIKVVLGNPGHKAAQSKPVSIIQWKTFLSALGAASAMAVAVVPTLYSVTWWITAAAIASVGLLTIVKTGDRVHVADAFKSFEYNQKNRVATLCRLAISSYVLWAVVYVAYPSWSLYLLAVLPVIGFSIYWGAKTEEYNLAHAKPTKPTELINSDAFEDRGHAKRGREILDAAGHPRVRIIGHSFIKGEHSWESGDQFTVQVPPTGMGK